MVAVVGQVCARDSYLRCDDNIRASSGGAGNVTTVATVVIHFVAPWAEPICGPHRAEVAEAAERIGAKVRECDIDKHWDEARAYNVTNVPAVAVEGRHESTLIGALGAADLIERLAD